MNDRELETHALALLSTMDAQKELELDYSRNWEPIKEELVKRGQRKFYFTDSQGDLHVVGYDPSNLSSTLNITKLEEVLDHKMWTKITTPGPRVLSQEKLTDEIRKGNIAESIVQSCIVPGKQVIRRNGPRKATQSEVAEKQLEEAR